MGSDQLQNRVSDDAEGLAHLPNSEIRAQIERIVNSRAFAGSERLCRFLTWTVEQSLQGRAENIKQYAIGREVFDRGTNFDPRIDSIVRTEAQRLRRKLSAYYESEGASDPILILFQPGSYAPVFDAAIVLTQQRRIAAPNLFRWVPAVTRSRFCHS